MKAYIINLKEAIERRNYMQKQLALLPPSLSSEFIEAVNGKGMNREQLEENFDYEKFRLRYAKEVRPGEIGCTLSHQKCYRRLLESKEKYVLILEDDIIVRQNIDFLLPELEKLLITNEPRIVLLSGWYWYLSTKAIKGHYRVANVYDAFLTHAYAINRAAASLIIESRPFMETKTFCSGCKVHCYQKEYRSQVKKVMRFSGKYMLFYHIYWIKIGVESIRHLLIKRRKNNVEGCG